MKENKILKGVGVSPGIAIGKAYVLDKESYEISPYCLVNDKSVDEEIKRFEEALQEAKRQVLKIKDEILKRGHTEASYIVDTHLMILEDSMLIGDTINTIKTMKVNAEWAFKITLHKFREVLDEVGDEYLRERKSDIDYVGERILNILLGKKSKLHPTLVDKRIVVAHDLSPCDTAQMAKENVIGFATDVGGKISHTAIMARALEIPAVVGLEVITEEVKDGDELIIDGVAGVVVINPSKDILRNYQEREFFFKKFEKELFLYKDLPAETKDGFRVRVEANIGLIEEVPSVIEHGAEGIGLYRTEFLYLNRPTLPSEEDHFEIYKKVAQQMYPNPVTIRTLDIGGDKFVSHINVAKEMNPAMGLRAIRFCLKEKGIFKTQLRAILRTSYYHENVRVMFPMISGVMEIKEVKRILEETKEELARENIPFNPNIKIGIMIEIPSAVTLSDILAKEVDFFSIGTNDLIQYTLAIDRVNEHVNYLYEPLHPAVLRAIKQVVEAAKGEGIEVGMCGEMAGEPLYAPILIGFGLDELSMNAFSVLRMKKIIRELKKSDCDLILKEVFEFDTASSIVNRVRSFMEEMFPEKFLRGIFF